MDPLLQAQLDALKATLETTLTEKAKKEIESQIKALEDKQKTAALEAAKNAPDVTKMQTELTETKAELETTETTLAKVVKSQDDMIAKQNERKVEKGKGIHFGSRLHEGIMKSEDKFRNMKKGDRITVDLLTPEEIKAAADMDFATNFPTADVSVAFLKPGIIELPKRKLHIRQLLQGGGMDNKSTFNYVKEVTG